MARKGSIYDTTTWIIAVSLVLGFIAGFLVARVKYRTQIGLISTMVMDKASEIDSLKAQKNRYLMVGGTMMEERDGVIGRMTSDVSLADGTKITTGGKVTRKDGTTILLKNGEYVLMDGSLKAAQ